jgi:hypothetical protein
MTRTKTGCSLNTIAWGSKQGNLGNYEKAAQQIIAPEATG